MLTIEKWNDKEAARLLARAPLSSDPALESKMRVVLDEVKKRGDAALADYTQKFDGVTLSRFRVSEEEMDRAVFALDPALRCALEEAKKNIEAFHEAERPQTTRIETRPGVVCELQWRAIEKVGLYVPGGTAPLFSAVLMLAIPAVLAGCEKIVLCAPPQKDGHMNAATVAAARLCGVKEVYALGGGQAIAAMAYGTAQVPKVDKIFGPGNAYVTMAKQLVAQDSGGAAIDMPAGPSEVMVIADGAARAEWVAADLLAQAEHDVSSQSMLVTTDEVFAQKVCAAALVQMEKLPRRAIIEKSLAQSRILVVSGREEAIKVANLYAPEHLIVHGAAADGIVKDIRTAGSIFVGDYSPETAGDYASGTNHVLPTYGAARAFGGLSLYSFLRSMTVQTLSREGLAGLSQTLVQMAEAEGLGAHAQAVRLRMKGD